MPPDSKNLSSLRDKSPSFHRLHATDLDRMRGMYLTAEELRGFDKYKVTPSIAIAITSFESSLTEIGCNIITFLSFFSTNRKILHLCQTS